MTRKAHICLSLGIGLLVIAVQAPAQEEQWLQYRSSREVGQIFGQVGSQRMKPSFERPTEVKLPQFKGHRQLFAKWHTPMVRSSYLLIALDQMHMQGFYDVLYIDSNADGSLDDEAAIAAYRTDQQSAYFGPVKVIFNVEDGPVTYHLNFVAHKPRTGGCELYASSAGWYEGGITVGGQKKYCVLIDYNTNGTFDDKSANAHDCDRILIGKQGSQNMLFTGNYIEVDETLYRPEIARDGAYIKLTKAENVSFGSVRLQESITEFSANGENGLFILKPEKGTACLPVGTYSVYSWAIERKDERGTNWKLEGAELIEENAFGTTEEKEATLSIGEPIIASLDASEREGTHSFSHMLKGRDGETITLTRNGVQPQAPKVRITSADGTYDRTYSFQYG